jgi:hypothetical protein
LLKRAPHRAAAQPPQNAANVIELLADFERHQEPQPPKTFAAASGSSSD